MSIARTLEGRLSATLALIAIIGWIVVAIVEAYPVARPDNATVIMVVSLAVVAFKFYQQDRASGKDPETQKAQMDASVELYLEKLAKYRAAAEGIEKSSPLMNLIRVLEDITKGSDASENDVTDEDVEQEQAIADGEPW